MVLRGRGVAQTHIYRRLAWQAWHKLTSTMVLRAGVALMALGSALGLGLVARNAAALCVAGVAQTHIYHGFAWQAWHKLTSTVVLPSTRGTNSHLPLFCVAGVALMALGGALGLGLVARDAAALCVAGAAQTHIYRRLAWQAWHKLTSTIVLRGRRGTDGTGWRAWSWFSRPWRRGTLHGRHGTNSHLPSFCVAAWQKITSIIVLPGRLGTDGTGWRAWSWFSRPWQRGTLRGRRGTNSHLPSFCVAGVAQTHIYHRFAWQAAWSWFSRPWRRSTLHGRRGTNSHLPSSWVAGVAQTHIYPSFCVAGVALMALGGALGLLWRRGTLRGRRGTNSHLPFVLRGRRGTNSHLPSFCVAGGLVLV